MSAMNVKRINVTLDEYTLGVLDAFITPRNISRSQLLRLAIPEYIKNHTDIPQATYIDTYKERIPMAKEKEAEAILIVSNLHE